MNKVTVKQLALLIVIGLVSSTLSVCNASIDRSPVKVTNRNSGPSYDLSDDVERVKLPVGDESSNESPSQSPPAASPFDDKNQPGMPDKFPRFPFFPLSSVKDSKESSEADGTPDVGHISIRRIFVVPLRSPASAPSSDNEDSKSQAVGPFMFLRPTSQAQPMSENVPDENANRVMRPLWPMFTPMMSPESHNMGRHHLFGSDSRSRNPFSSLESPRPSVEREDPMSKSPSEQDGDSQSADPIQSLIRIMLDSIREAHNQMSDLSPNSNDNTRNQTDLEKSASNNEKRDQNSFDLSKPKKPTSHNETREDVVEIDGRKYLRKTVLNRHVGENMVFMTRRLIFVPLNETDSSTTTSTTETPISTTILTPSSSASSNNVDVTPTTTTTTTTTTTISTPIASSTEPKVEESTTASSTSTTTASTPLETTSVKPEVMTA